MGVKFVLNLFQRVARHRLCGEAFWALLGQGVSALALLIGTRLLTELITPAVYGQVALFNGFVALGVAVFSYPFIAAGMRIGPECVDAGQRRQLYRVVYRLTLGGTGLAIAALLLGGAVYSYLAQANMAGAVLTGLLLAVTVQRELGIQLAIGERKQRLASLWQMSDSLLRPTLAITLAWWQGGRVEWVLLGYSLASLLSNLAWWWVDRGQKSDAPFSRLSPLRPFGREVWRYALPLIPMELIFWVNGLGDRYVIGYLLTATEVGLYAATYTLINEAFNRSAMVLLRTFQPVYFQAYAERRRRQAFRILWLWIGSVAALGVAGLLAVLLARDWLAAWVLAESYHAAVGLMPALALGCALHALGTALAQPLLARKQPGRLLRGRLCGVVTALISLPWLVSHDGLSGAAWANPLYFGVEALVLAWLARPWQCNRPQTEPETRSARRYAQRLAAKQC